MSARRIVRTVLGAGVLLALASCSSSATTSSSSTSSPTTASSATGGGAGPATTMLNVTSRVQTYSVTSRDHTSDPVNYPQTPPVGGDHYPVWQNCGFYPQAIQTELGVHAMEHGAVWITYQPTLPADQIDMLKALAHSRGYILVSPWTVSALPAPVVASAWGVQLKATGATDAGIAAFVKMYDQGPQTPEQGAACTGGFGTPQ